MIQQIVICEDEISDAHRITSTIEKHLSNLNITYQIITFHSGEDLIEACKTESVHPHIIFMDIELHGMNGIETTSTINNILPTCQIIYITNHLQFATDVYTTEHRYFVLKNEFEQRVVPIFNKIFSLSNAITEEFIIPLKRKTQVVVLKEDIILIERSGRGSKFFVNDTIYESNLPLKDIEHTINYNSIVQCHNSFYINLTHIKSYEREQLELTNGLSVPISRKYQPLIRNQFAKWSQDHLFN